MKIKNLIGLFLGIGLFAFGVYHLVIGLYLWAIIKIIIGIGLMSLKFVKNRYGTIIFGHLIVVVGCILITVGILYLPLLFDQIRETGVIKLSYIFGMPLFWGLFATLGGICTIYHGFCKCMRSK